MDNANNSNLLLHNATGLVFHDDEDCQGFLGVPEHTQENGTKHSLSVSSIMILQALLSLHAAFITGKLKAGYKLFNSQSKLFPCGEPLGLPDIMQIVPWTNKKKTNEQVLK